MSDLYKLWREYVQTEASEELVCIESHDSGGSSMCVVFVGEGYFSAGD